MTAVNVHERRFSAKPADVGALIDSLGSPSDRLWPRSRWPAMRLDPSLAAVAAGGHGPIRYTVEAFEPRRRVTFRFTRPREFRGTHSFMVVHGEAGRMLLRHRLEMELVGFARLTWSLVYRHLHDALIEDALDRASTTLGQAVPPRVRRLRVFARCAILRRRRRAYST